MGRPKRGALSSYPDHLSKDVNWIRSIHTGWGAASILLELKEKYNYTAAQLPGTASINRYIKEQGMVQKRSKVSPLPVSDKNRCGPVKRPHDQWELDAKGSLVVDGLGYCAPINIWDRKSKSACISFPIPVRNKKTQPSTKHYYWAARLAFERRGLPRSIRVDHDSVFYENNSSSPFPKLFQLWLIGLGVELCFITRKPPSENGMIERSHQTINKQVYKGQTYDCWKALFQFSDERIDKLNYKLPNRMLGNTAPLVFNPKAAHSGRPYTVHKEKQLIDLKLIYRYLAKGKWFRTVSKDKTISLGGKVYYLKNAQPKSQLQITFCNRRKKLLFHDVNEQLITLQTIKNISFESLMAGSVKQIVSMRYKLSNRRNCPL